MCDPLSLGITAVSKGGSAYFQNKAAKKIKKKRNDVAARATADVNEYRDRSRGEFQKSLNTAGPAAMGDATQQAVLSRTAAYQGAINNPQNVVSDNASDAAKRAILSALERGRQGMMSEAARRAAVEAYGDASFGRDIALGRNAQAINQNASFAEGRQRVAELEFEDAERAGSRDAAIAGIVDALGTIGNAAAGPVMGTAPGYDVSQGIRWNTARMPGKTMPGPLRPGVSNVTNYYQ